MSRSRSHCSACFSLLLLILCFSLASTVVVAARPTSFLLSDGVSYHVHSSHKLLSINSSEDEHGSDTCEEIYGFLPCSKTTFTNLFLIMVHGYMIFVAATCLTKGSDLLSEVLGVGIVSGFFLPLLGSLPDALLILVSGLFGSMETAQEKLSVGMGLLAGAAVVRLTVIWGTCVVVGKCDLKGTLALDETNTRGCNMLGSGVSTDIWTSYSTRIMVISVLPFLVVRVPQSFTSSTSEIAILIACIFSSLMLISYGLYQVFQPWIQERRIDYVKHKRVLSGFLKHLKSRAMGKLRNPDGTLNDDVVEKLFKSIDADQNDHLCRKELRAFIIGIQLEETSVAEEDIVEKIMNEFDTERQDDKIDLDEFKAGISKLLNLVKGDNAAAHVDVKTYIAEYEEKTKIERLLLDNSGDEAAEEVEKDMKNTIKAVMFLVLGTVILALFAEPLVDSFHHFSDATGIPMFFLSFIALPIATNSGEAVSAIKFASKKTRKSASLTLSELHGMVTVNNLLCLTVFLALVYARGLAWNFTSEVLITFLVCIIMDALGSFRTAFPLWTAALAFLLYPCSLVLVYVLDYKFGWS